MQCNHVLPIGIVSLLVACSGSGSVAPTPLLCIETHDPISLSVEGMGYDDSCAFSTAGTGMLSKAPYDLVGRIVDANSNRFHLDLCITCGDCTGDRIVTVTADAPGLDLSSLPTGAFVAARVDASHGEQCRMSIALAHLDSCGAPGAILGGSALFVAAVGTSDVAGAPFDVQTVPQSCTETRVETTNPPAQIISNEWVLRFVGQGQSTPPTVDVEMGQTKTGVTLGTFHDASIRNLRSYSNGLVPDQLGYWVLEAL